MTTGLLVAAGAVWVWWQRAREPVEAPRARAQRAFVRVADGSAGGAEDRVLQERARYFDPTPLFVPTPQNYGYLRLPDRLRTQPGQIFGDYAPKLGATLPEITAGGAEAESLAGILARANEVPFAGLGERPSERQPLADRAAMMEIKSLTPGRFSQSVPIVDAQPPRRDFGPMEFLVTVGVTGLVGEPVLVSGSGWPQVDVFFREFLVSQYRLGARLGPGRYRVTVGP